MKYINLVDVKNIPFQLGTPVGDSLLLKLVGPDQMELPSILSTALTGGVNFHQSNSVRQEQARIPFWEVVKVGPGVSLDIPVGSLVILKEEARKLAAVGWVVISQDFVTLTFQKKDLEASVLLGVNL